MTRLPCVHSTRCRPGGTRIRLGPYSEGWIAAWVPQPCAGSEVLKALSTTKRPTPLGLLTGHIGLLECRPARRVRRAETQRWVRRLTAATAPAAAAPAPIAATASVALRACRARL